MRKQRVTEAMLLVVMISKMSEDEGAHKEINVQKNQRNTRKINKIITGSMAYKTRRFNVTFTRAPS